MATIHEYSRGPVVMYVRTSRKFIKFLPKKEEEFNFISHETGGFKKGLRSNSDLRNPLPAACLPARKCLLIIYD